MINKQPVIAQIIPELSQGGAEQGTIDVAAELVRAGSKSIVISQGGNRVHELKRVGAEHIDMPVKSKNPLQMYRNVSKLKKLIQEYNIDLIHARSRAPAWSAYYACKSEDCSLVTTFHAPYNIENKAKLFYNSVMAKGDRVIAISRHVENYIHNNYVVDPSKVRLIHRGVAIEKFHPTMVTAERMIKLTQEWRIPDGAPVIMLPGRLTRWKGQLEFLEAIRILNRPDVFVLLIGSDQGRKKYREEVDEAIRIKGLEKQVRIIDNCADMPAAYVLANIVVSASIEPEGFGRIPIEAQAMGRPVIGTNHGGAAETIIHNETGWLVPPADSNMMAETMKHVLSLNENARAILATKAMNNVAQNFTKDLMCDKTLNVYAELIQQRYGLTENIQKAAPAA
jgi:glycosyltransferase involved in cell wall biosynthesis